MNNIVLTNNKDLRLVGMRVGVLSTLRIELPLIDAAATNVEVIITNAATHTAYLATYSASSHCWICDIAAAQFPVTGKQSYEVAYLLGGKQFWDGKGWIDITEATTSGISPTPVPPPTRYVCVSVNGYTAQSVEGNIRIPKLFLASGEPVGTDGYIEGDEIIDTETGYRWVLASITNALTWVQVAVNLSSYYTKAQTDAAINALAAYYITANAQGAAFATYAALANAEAYYSGGAVRIPTRNDYAVVLADETHGGAEYRYIYAVPTEGGEGHWEAQYPIETNEYTALQHKPQIGGVELVGNKTLAQLGIASTADATLTGLSAWVPVPAQVEWRGSLENVDLPYWEDGKWWVDAVAGGLQELSGNPDAVSLTYVSWGETITATRTALSGYQLGSQSTKPLASEAEAEALRAAVAGKQDALTAQQLANIADVPNKANASDLRYAIAQKQVVNSTVAVDDRTVNLVQGSYSTMVAVSIPSQVSNKSRDFIIAFFDGVDTTITIEDATLFDPSGASISTLNAKAQTLTFWRLTEILNRSGNVNPMFLVTGANQQAALGYTPENAANKVTAISAQSTDTQYPSAKCVYDALQGVDVKPTRIYNAEGTDALDDKGQLFRSDIVSDSGNYFHRNGYGYSRYLGTAVGTYDGAYQTIYCYGGENLAYIPSSGNVYVYYGTYGESSFVIYQNSNYLRCTCTPNLNPTQPNVDLAPQQVQGQLTWTFTPRTIVSTMLTTPYARFAIETMPTAWAASTTYTVGVCASSGGKAYRCKTAHTSGSTFDATKWDEIPVLAQKADAADLRYSFNAATVGTGTTPTVTGLADRAINSATLGSSVTAATVTLPAATTGRARDFFIDLTIEATTAPTLTFIDPATNTTANVTFGADSLADIAPGYNLVLWTELPNNRWLVSVRHEEAS